MHHKVPLRLALKFEGLADQRGVSKVARGVTRSRSSEGGFFEAAKRVGGSQRRLASMPIKAGAKQSWWQRRDAFCTRHSAEQVLFSEPLIESSGRYKGLPTRRELAKIMWLCSSIPLERLSQMAKQL